MLSIATFPFYVSDPLFVVYVYLPLVQLVSLVFFLYIIFSTSTAGVYHVNKV